MGFSLGAASLAGCRAPTQKAIPLATGSDQMTAGVSRWYATTCGGCDASCSLLVKQRDGRPIKIEGNDASPLFGGTCATGQATVLSLYDDERLRGPLWRGKPAPWVEVDASIERALLAAQQEKRKVVLLSGTLTSPSTLSILSQWSTRLSSFSHVTYDASPLSGVRAAALQCFGEALVPHYVLEKAKVIVALEADFLGTWLSPVEFARQYARRRGPQDGASWHVQYESGYSVTGSNADLRVAVAPSDLGLIAVSILRRIAGYAGAREFPNSGDLVEERSVERVAARLWAHRGESLVLCGSNEVDVQIVVNTINLFLGNLGKTIDLRQPSLQRQGDDAAVTALVDEMNEGQVHTLFLHGVNPAYDYPDPERFLRGLSKVVTSISLADRRDETSVHTDAVCPDHHFLESWGDAEPVAGHLSLRQPLIAPLFDTRAAPESFLKWSGQRPDYHAFLREHWRARVFAEQAQLIDFDTFWDRALERGVATRSVPPHGVEGFHADWRSAARRVIEERRLAPGSPDGLELHCHQGVAMREGRQSNNPWLLELPDPITTVSWGNVAAMAPSLARQWALEEGDVVGLQTAKGTVELPLVIQPGQHGRTISVALGYGRTRVGRAGNDVGVNAYALTTFAGGTRRFGGQEVKLHKTGRRQELARTQSHFSMEGRDLVRETSLAELAHPERKEEAALSLWPPRAGGEHSWGMSIDLNRCIGCAACVVACQAENNVPVVGREEVARNRIMHWVRVDRYFRGPDESPESVHQPMMCQHCANAPCETVCPVLATTTSSEGLNQQTYNRCIGTRYCANNCPYKVRRFNWFNYTENPRFDYNMQSPVGRLVLNPDVTVRSRGVMEKCSMCVQRIQLGKNTALREKRALRDGDVRTACQESCPTEAIVFGDLLDAASRASARARDPRSFAVLAELGTRPNVTYLRKIRRKES